ncbi:MAG: hypothetical protein ACJ78Q_06145 [Chloroflexia bacterium]
MEQDELRSMIDWHREYHPEWDDAPDEYAEHGVVHWGRSRRLGLLTLGRTKAYLGVQHVDPNLPGWAIVDNPQARFFLSLFVAGRCITLSTFPTMDAALQALGSFLERDDSGD